MDQVFDYINIKSPKTIIGYGHKLVKVLKETQNEQHLFLKEFNFKRRHEHFTPEKRYRNSLNDTCSKLAQETELASLWTELLDQKGEPDHQGTKEMFQKICKKSCKRRCITFLATDQLNPKKDEQKSSIPQILKAFEMKTSHIKKDATFNSVQHNDQCFRCEDESHWARQCPNKASHDSACLCTKNIIVGQTGHLKVNCPATNTNTGKKTTCIRKVKHNNSSNHPPTIQILRLPEILK